MASALTFPASENKHDIRLVGTILDDAIIDRLREDNYHITLKRTLPSGIKFYKFGELDTALDGAELAIGGVSSFGVEWFLENVLPRIPEDLPLLSVTKGMYDLEDGSLMTYPEFYEKKLAEKGLKRNILAVGGPCTSYELADGDHSNVTFCGRDLESLRLFKSAMECSYYHVSISQDVVGVECAVAMKNAYALAVTLAIGLSEKRDGIGIQHYNSQAALFGQSVREMRRLLALVGGSDDYIVLGAGDLYVTVFGGRTRLLGTLLGRGMTISEALEELKGITLESVVITERTARAVNRLIELGKVDAKKFPLLLTIGGILKGAKTAEDIPWDEFE